MFIVQVVGAIKGMESGEEMRRDLQEQVKRVLENAFQEHGLFEVFITSEEKTIEICAVEKQGLGKTVLRMVGV